MLTRRSALAASGLVIGALAAPASIGKQSGRTKKFKLRIAPTKVEIAPGVEYSTFAYNDSVPGPVLQMREGERVAVEVENMLAASELLHWHGFHIPSYVDGAEEEGTPKIDRFSKRTYSFVPAPSGTQWYHTHMMGAKALMFGAYSGLFGFAIIERRNEPGRYDREVPIAMHHWGPRWVSGQTLRPKDPAHGLEVAYDYGTMNGRLLAHHEPIRVREGERVLFRLLNASATENSWTSLSGHQMQVVALDGQFVPSPQTVDVVLLGPGERADIIVHMNNPGRWILGSAVDAERDKGMAMIVEYAGASGDAKWEPVKRHWEFQPFAHPDGVTSAPDQILPINIDRIAGGTEGYNRWTINGKAWPETDRISLKKGKRYRLHIKNHPDHGHPIHLHRHLFEVASWDGKLCPGLMKDTINVRPNSSAELDFTANANGPTLLHCHQAKHQDFGLMALMLYEGDVEPKHDHAAMMREIESSYCGPKVRPA